MDKLSEVKQTGSLQILSSRLGLPAGKITRTALASLRPSTRITEPPPGLSDVHRAYWTALKAHQEARVKYGSLKAELDSLASQQPQSIRATGSNPSVVAQGYVPLLQQREALRRLKVIETALASITSVNNDPTSMVVDEYLKSRAGEIPLLPRANTQLNDRNEAAEERTLELKRAVLSAKHTVEMHHSHEHSNGVTEHDIDAQIFALKEARNELIAWIEQKLGVISNAQADNARPTESLAVEGDDPPIPVTKSEIGQIYEQYITTRQSLLQALQHPQMTSMTRPDSPELTRDAQSVDENAAAAITMLPFISPLMSMQKEAQDAAQLVPFACKQTQRVSKETNQLLRRLADESHLVQPGSSHGKVWATASAASNLALSDHVADRVNSSFKDIDKTDSMLRAMERLPGLLDRSTS